MVLAGKIRNDFSVECAFHLSVCQLAECAIDAPFKCTWDSFQRYHNGFCWLDCFSHLSSTSLDGSFCCTNRSEAAKQPKIENTQTFQWSIRRTFADFSEAWFYGNELVGGLVILGVLTDWFVNINHITNGSGLVPDILMRQMIASAVGVFLYRKHFAEEGWYPTFMPLVSIVPGVILMTGGGFWLSLAIAVLAGISAAPVGNYIAKRLPPFVPGAVGFVSGMAVVTILLSAVLHTFDILYSE